MGKCWGVRGALKVGIWPPRLGLGLGQLLPAQGGPRPRWRRWLRLQGSGSAAASPSQHPPPRSARAAGPRPERQARARTREAGRHLGPGARARALGAALAPRPERRTQHRPPASVSPRPCALAGHYPCARFPNPRALPLRLPTPAQPRAALHSEAPDSPCAPTGGALNPRGATHPRGGSRDSGGGARPRLRGAGSEDAACPALAAACPGGEAMRAAPRQ